MILSDLVSQKKKKMIITIEIQAVFSKSVHLKSILVQGSVPASDYHKINRIINGDDVQGQIR